MPGFVRVRLLVGQVGDCDVRAFAGIGYRDSAADPAVAAGNQRCQAGQKALAKVAFLTVVRLGYHVGLEAWPWLMWLVREAGRGARSGIFGHGGGTRERDGRFMAVAGLWFLVQVPCGVFSMTCREP